jgi:hypothetical protein
VTPAQRIAALELEFERLKQRADHLDRVLQGDPDAWVHLIELLPAHVAEVTLDKAVAEARQGALAMATIVKTLAGLTAEEGQVPQADPLDQLAKARAAKIAAANA